MENNFVSAFWLARFDSDAALQEYLDLDYSKDEEPSSPFAKAIGHSYDDDLLECVYAPDDDLMEEIVDFSYAEHYREALGKKLVGIDMSKYNTIIMLNGGCYEAGDINEWLFEEDLKSVPGLLFVGKFAYNLNDDE